MAEIAGRMHRYKDLSRGVVCKASFIRVVGKSFMSLRGDVRNVSCRPSKDFQLQGLVKGWPVLGSGAFLGSCFGVWRVRVCSARV